MASGTASADTLREALVSTYRNEPDDHRPARDRCEAPTPTSPSPAPPAGPQVSATVGLNRDLTRSGILDTGGKGPNLSVGVDLSYPLFNGGSVRN